jgi:hypothetical protein
MIPGIPGMLVHSARVFGIGEEPLLAINASWMTCAR